MNHKALIGLVRSRVAYIKEWPEAANVVLAADEEPQPERVFDLSEILRPGNEEQEVSTDYTALGRHLPFPIFAVVGTGYGVFIVSGADDGLYAYCYSAPVQMLIVYFADDGWKIEGWQRNAGLDPVHIPGTDSRIREFAEAVGLVLAVVEDACNDTRHIVSYRLNRAERRNAVKEVGGTLDQTLVHHVCLDHASREKLTVQRGVTVVPTPKRLHEVRAHWRHLRSGIVTRVRAHTRGQRGGTLLPRIYTATPSVPHSPHSDTLRKP